MRREIICKECGLWTDPIWHQHHTCCSLQDKFLGKLWQGAQQSNDWAQAFSPVSWSSSLPTPPCCSLGFPWNFKVSLSLVTLLCFFPFSSLQWFQVALLFFFLVFQSCYWLLIQGQNKLIPSQFAWRKADDWSVNSSRIDLSACCPSNIQAARHILCNKNTVQTIAGFNWKIRCSVILDDWFSANYKVGQAPLESQQCLTNPSLQVI